jgi:hypothetical protein
MRDMTGTFILLLILAAFFGWVLIELMIFLFSFVNISIGGAK